MPSSLAISVVSVAFGVTVVSAAQVASAQHDAREIPVPIRAAPDELSSHFIISPRLAYLIPMGLAEQRFAQRGYISSAPSFGADVALGISRYVALHARFDYAKFGEGHKCPKDGSCEATSTAFGAGVDYHLVNGAAFDPWMRAGVGYRIMHYDLSLSGSRSEFEYKGVEWLHLAVGGDWFPHSMIGFGPYLAFDIGSYGSKPDEGVPSRSSDSEGATHTFFSIGLRGVFDPTR